MSTANWFALCGIAGVIFLVVDLVWLGLVANTVYSKLLGDLKADGVAWVPALAFYLIFVLGLVYFAVRPAIDGGSVDIGQASRDGAIFGFVAYATWDLTNAAVIRNWPQALVPIDMAWGTVLSCIIATGSAYAARAWFV